MRANSTAPFLDSFPGTFKGRSGLIALKTDFGVCNGRTIDDAKRCENSDCRLFSRCDRVILRQNQRKRPDFQVLLGLD